MKTKIPNKYELAIDAAGYKVTPELTAAVEAEHSKTLDRNLVDEGFSRTCRPESLPGLKKKGEKPVSPSTAS